MPRDIITVIDIGSSKIVGITGEIDNGEVRSVVGIAEVPSEGVSKGEIDDFQEFLSSISRLRLEMEESKIRISPNVFFGISSWNMTYRIGRGIIRIDGKPITSEHVEAALDNARPQEPPRNTMLISVLPRIFILDDYQKVKNPIGMTAQTLEVEAFMFFAPETLLVNIMRALNELDFKVDKNSPLPNALASASSTLREDEKESGTLLIDMGHGTTDVILFFKGVPSLTFTLPVGSYNITYDISLELKTTLEEAERIKRTVVTLNLEEISDDQVLTYQPRYGTESRTVRLRNVVEDVVIPRLERSVISQIKKVVYKVFEGAIPPIGGIVLTGGGALLRGMDRFFSKSFEGIPVRIGAPIDDWVPDDLRSPLYSASIGLLKLGAGEIYKESLEPSGIVVVGKTSRKRTLFQRIKRFISEFF